MCELKACPFCGKTDITMSNKHYPERYRIGCSCKRAVTSWVLSPARGALSEWNTRPIEDALRRERDEFKSAFLAMSEANQMLNAEVESMTDKCGKLCVMIDERDEEMALLRDLEFEARNLVTEGESDEERWDELCAKLDAIRQSKEGEPR